MTVSELSTRTPVSITDALDCMREALDYFQAQNDHRAVFLHAYYIITRNVYDSIRRRDHPFVNPEWMITLAGHFATLYFRSLMTFERPVPSEMAWKLAHGLATRKASTVVQDMLLGIVAHIGYDLAQAICANINADSAGSHAQLALHKHDHDQANRILLGSIDEIWRVLPRVYGGGLPIVDAITFGLDRQLAATALRRYRECVWWHAMDLIAAKNANSVADVLQRMNAQSWRINQLIAGEQPEGWLVVSLARHVLCRRRRRLQPVPIVPVVPGGPFSEASDASDSET